MIADAGVGRNRPVSASVSTQEETLIRLVLFGSGGPMSLAVWDAIAAAAPPVALVTPGSLPVRSPRGAVRALLRRRGTRPLRRRATGNVLQVQAMPGRVEALADQLAPLRPDLLCVAGFPFLLPPRLLALPRLGSLNLHPSPLPRRRGPDPLFWTYFHDDREAGVTLHWIDSGVDTGPILSQETLALPRGLPVEALYGDLARRGAALLQRALPEIAAGTAPHIPQDQGLATHDPTPRPGTWRIDFQIWGAERLWHFLAGLGGRNGRVLHDAAGRPFLHGPATGYRLERPEGPVGRVDRHGSGWRVSCRDGSVDVAGPGRRARAVRLLSAWRA
jgi:methionyl-tRNA formyltransferase